MSNNFDVHYTDAEVVVNLFAYGHKPCQHCKASFDVLSFETKHKVLSTAKDLSLSLMVHKILQA